MKISANIAIWLCAAFALLCGGFAFTGFSSLATITDEAEASFRWVLGSGLSSLVGVVFGVLSGSSKKESSGTSNKKSPPSRRAFVDRVISQITQAGCS